MQDHPQLLADLRNSIVPVVALWPGTSPLEFPTADTDDRAGIRAGLSHLASLGHRRIAFVSAELPGDYRVREDAYLDFMRDRFGGVPPGYLERCPNTLAGGDAALRRLMDAARAAHRGGHLDRPGRRRRAARRAQPRRHRARPAVGGRLRRHPDRGHTVPALTTLRMPISEIVGSRGRPRRSPWPADPAATPGASPRSRSSSPR